MGGRLARRARRRQAPAASADAAGGGLCAVEPLEAFGCSHPVGAGPRAPRGHPQHAPRRGGVRVGARTRSLGGVGCPRRRAAVLTAAFCLPARGDVPGRHPPAKVSLLRRARDGAGRRGGRPRGDVRRGLPSVLSSVDGARQSRGRRGGRAARPRRRLKAKNSKLTRVREPKGAGALVQASPCTLPLLLAVPTGPSGVPASTPPVGPASGTTTAVAEETTNRVMLLAGKVALREVPLRVASASRTTAVRFAGP